LIEDRQQLVAKEADFHAVQERFCHEYFAMKRDLRLKNEELQTATRKVSGLERENQDL
jgi:hypothetical protein